MNSIPIILLILKITTVLGISIEFYANLFSHFKGEDGAGHFNDWVMANGGAEKR